MRGPAGWSSAVMLALGCSGSESASGGCNNSGQRCDVNATATVCGDRITMECFEGATPDAASQCEIALEQDNEAIYCCTSATEEADGAGLGGWGGGGSGAVDSGGGGFGGAGT